MYVEKLLNNKVYISISKLLDITKIENRNKILEIASIFGDKFYIKLVISEKYTPYYNSLFKEQPIVTKRKHNINVLVCYTTLLELKEVLDISAKCDTAIELFAYNEIIELCDILEQHSVIDFIFNMFITDNDGLVIVFDEKTYKSESILTKIESII